MTKSSLPGFVLWHALAMASLLAVAGCAGLDDTWSGTRDGANSACSSTKDGAGSAWSSAKDGASSAWSSAKDGASSAWTSAKDGASSAWSSAKDDADDAWVGVHHPGYLGRLIYSEPPPVTVIAGGASGKLLSGGGAPELPDAAVDDIVSPALKQWLTFEERRSLATASERAAIGATAEPIDWQARDGGDAVTAVGAAVAIGGAYRSERGPLCRDVRQSVLKNKAPHSEAVALCRAPDGAGIALWTVADAD
jgi:hypothetical protein